MGVGRMRLVKCGRFIVVLLIVIFCFSSVARAEERTAKEYMAEGIRAAYDNMHLVYQAYCDENGELEEQPAGHVAMWQEWDKDWNLISRTYLGPDGMPVNRIDGYAKVLWINDSVIFYDLNGETILIAGKNLAVDVPPEKDLWSEWISPQYNTEYAMTVAHAYLGDKEEGDQYTSQIQIEFNNVKATTGKRFLFCTQGTVDQRWDIGNIWDWSLAYSIEPPKDGIYTFEHTYTLDQEMANANNFFIGFRCDNWESGSFRIRNAKVEKGSVSTEWVPPIK